MTLVHRVDAGGRLARAVRTPAGGVRVPGTIARACVLSYPRADGTTVRELVPLEEVRSRAALESLRDAPVTVGHPTPDRSGSQLVTPETYRRLAVGHVSGEARADAEHILAELAILDAATIERIDAGELVELSAGYTCEIDPTPGTFKGERYDAVQRNRVYNHVALLPPGNARAGSSVALRVDSFTLDPFAVAGAWHREAMLRAGWGERIHDLARPAERGDARPPEPQNAHTIGREAPPDLRELYRRG